jgi:lysophospholipase L1-like esterase
MAGERGVALKLVATIARSGWTTQDLIEKGLDQLDTAQPEFVTIMIGTNDAQQNISPAQFQTNMRIILDKVGAVVPPEKTVLVTIPDYLVTPTGAVKASGQDPAGEVRNLNTILRNEAAERGIVIADLYEVSRHLGTNPRLIHRDGLHPSAAGHQEWAVTILPAVLSVFGK